MVGPKKHGNTSPGFALIVVLSTLAILTLLFATATRLSLAHIQFQSTEMMLAERSALNIALLRAVVPQLAEERRSGEYQITLDGELYVLRAVDVGGLVDLNAAAPPLLEAYLTTIGLTPDEIQRVFEWRRTSKRFLRVEDLLRASGARALDVGLIRRTATVFSGRPGLAREEMPEELVGLLTPYWRDSWVSSASRVNFHLLFELDGHQWVVGAVHTQLTKSAKTLWVL